MCYNIGTVKKNLKKQKKEVITMTEETTARWVVIILALVAIIITGIVYQGQIDEQAQQYNNGIHSIDGGKWVLTCTLRHGGEYVYTCDHCHAQLTTLKKF